MSDFANTDGEVGWICNLWLSSREQGWEKAAAAAARGASWWGAGASEVDCSRGQLERGATPLPAVVTVANVLRTVARVACMMLYYWSSGEKWNWCCNPEF